MSHHPLAEVFGNCYYTSFIRLAFLVCRKPFSFPPTVVSLALSWEALPGALLIISYEYSGFLNLWKAVFSSCRLSSQPTCGAVRKLGDPLHCPLPPFLLLRELLKLIMLLIIAFKLWSSCPHHRVHPHKALHTVHGCVGCTMNRGLLLRKQGGNGIQPYAIPQA